MNNGYATSIMTPAQELRLKTCAAERHGTTNAIIGIGVAAVPYYGAYKGFKHGKGILSTVLWTLGGWFLGGFVGGLVAVPAVLAVNSDCMREAGIFNGG